MLVGGFVVQALVQFGTVGHLLDGWRLLARYGLVVVDIGCVSKLVSRYEVQVAGNGWTFADYFCNAVQLSEAQKQRALMTDSGDDGKAFEWDSLGYERAFIVNVRKIREQRGMTQTELARLMSEEGFPFHQPTVQRLESGQRPLKFTEAFALANVLGADFSDLLRSMDLKFTYLSLVEQARPDALHRYSKAALDTLNALISEHEDTDALLDTYLEAVRSAESEPEAGLVGVINYKLQMMVGMREELRKLWSKFNNEEGAEGRCGEMARRHYLHDRYGHLCCTRSRVSDRRCDP